MTGNDTWQLVRPNLGQPLVVGPDDLLRFDVTLAGKTDTAPSRTTVKRELSRNPPRLIFRRNGVTKSVALTVSDARGFVYCARRQRMPVDAEDYQYARGFRWEFQVTVGLDPAQVDSLSRTVGWPAMANMKYKTKLNYHAICVNKALAEGRNFTIFHVTDTHVTQRNDQIVQMFARTRNRTRSNYIARKFVNVNDNLRAIFAEANRQVRAGEPIVVVITGDLIDYYYDGFRNGRFIWSAGKANRWKDSNFWKLLQIVTGLDERAPPLECPVFTVLGNHDFLIHEQLMAYTIQLIKGIKHDRNSFKAYGLSMGLGREYDRCARVYENVADPKSRDLFLRQLIEGAGGGWQTLDSDQGYRSAKPRWEHLGCYLERINYDTDFEVRLGPQHLLCFNTGPDRYPSKEDFLNHAAGVIDLADHKTDYMQDGSHQRGFISSHVKLLKAALKGQSTEGNVLLFCHGPLVNFQKHKNSSALFEDAHEAAGPVPNKASDFLKKLYGKSEHKLKKAGFPLRGTRYFKRGARDPYLNFACADGKRGPEYLQIFNLIAPPLGTRTSRPVIVYSGHTHKVHEFRLEGPKTPQEYGHSTHYYFVDKYCKKYLKPVSAQSILDKIRILYERRRWLKHRSPLLVTSGGQKNKPPQFRETRVRETIIESVEMRDLERPDRSASPIPGSRLVALRTSNGNFLSREPDAPHLWHARSDHLDRRAFVNVVDLGGNQCALQTEGGWLASVSRRGEIQFNLNSRSDRDDIEVFSLHDRGQGRLALQATNGLYVCAEGGGGREVGASRRRAGPWETFEVVDLETDDLRRIRQLSSVTQYLQHVNFAGRPTDILGETHYYLDTLFRATPGLANSEGVSFEALTYPGYYLRHQNFVLKLQRTDASNLFKQDATFMEVPGLHDELGISFEAINFPDHFLRFNGSRITLDKRKTSESFKDQTTFDVSPASAGSVEF